MYVCMCFACVYLCACVSDVVCMCVRETPCVCIFCV